MPTRMISRRGFTLIETLAVLFLIGVLILLCIPAVQTAREEARRTQCKNNLKQLGIALHSYHDTYGRFPPGWVQYTGTAPANDGTNHWGWGIYIVPFMDSTPLYNMLNVGNSPDGMDQALELSSPVHSFRTLPEMQHQLNGFLCPSDGGPVTNTNKGFSTDGIPHHGPFVSLSNYIGVHDHHLPVTSTVPLVPNPASGIFSQNSSVRVRDIKDGTANTFMVGERAWTIPARGGIFSSNAGVVFGLNSPGRATDSSGPVYIVGTGCAPINGINTAANSPVAAPPQCSGRYGFSSVHPGGAQFLLCDGSVKFVTQNINFSTNASPTAAGVYQRWMHKEDGAVIGPNY